MVAMSYFCRQNVSQISLEIVANCSHPSEILALPTELQRKLSKTLKVTYIITIMYYVTPMVALYNGFYLFLLSRAVNSNRLIFDPSEVKIGL